MKRLERGVPFVGVTRFSVYSPGNRGLNTSAKHDHDDAYLSELYATERMDDRLKIFGEISAPIYQSFAETYDYTHLVQYSEEMPQRYKDALHQIAANYPVVRPVLVTNETMDVSVREYLQTWDPAFSGIFVWLRVDDDDVLSIDYLEALNRIVVPANVGIAISFPSVMIAQYASGRFVNFRQLSLPKNSIGQAYVCWANVSSGVFDIPRMFPHQEIDKFMPLLLDPRGIRALQVRHAWQDTSNTDSKVGHRIAHRSFELGKLPYVNIKHVAEKFPTVPVDSPPEALVSAEVKLEVEEWVNVEELFARFSSGVVIQAEWELEFAAAPDDGASLSIEFDNPDKVEGHFPRDAARGDYRRLYVNSRGEGENFFVFPAGAKPRRLRLNADGESRQVRSGLVRFWEIGEL